VVRFPLRSPLFLATSAVKFLTLLSFVSFVFYFVFLRG
jgi:hypothetical protein